MRKHGREYDIILDCYMADTGRPAPFGLCVKSKKTGAYTWFDRKQVCFDSYDKLPAPKLIEDVDSYTSCYDLLDEYFDVLLKSRKVMKSVKTNIALVKQFYRQKLCTGK